MRMRFASLFTNDEDKAVDFYTNVLGFRLVVDNPTPFGGRFLMFAPPGGGANVVLTRPFREGQIAGGPANIAWETDDIHSTFESLTAKGVVFTLPPTKRPWGGVEASFADQDGNVFMLHQAGDLR